MDRGKDPLLLPYIYTLSSNIVGLLLALLNLQYYQKCESMILKTGWKVNLFSDNQIIITYWLKLILVEDLIMWKRSFNYFWLTLMLVTLKIKVSLLSVTKFLNQCHPPYTRWVSSHRVLYPKFLGSYNICITYLHVIEACLNVTIALF